MEAPLAEDSRGEAPLRIVTPTNVLKSQGLGLKMYDQFDQDVVVALTFKGSQSNASLGAVAFPIGSNDSQ